MGVAVKDRGRGPLDDGNAVCHDHVSVDFLVVILCYCSTRC